MSALSATSTSPASDDDDPGRDQGLSMALDRLLVRTQGTEHELAGPSARLGRLGFVSGADGWHLFDEGLIGGLFRNGVPVRHVLFDRVGTFTVQWKDPHHVNTQGQPMPYSTFFADGGVAFHEGSLQRYSEGCVHLSHDDAVHYYDVLQVGDEVQVH